MVIARRINPLARAIAVMSAVMVVSGGVTFAALQSQASLTGNTISTISSNSNDLVVNNEKDNTFHKTETGFKFNNLTPGTFSDEKNFQLRNTSDNTQDIRVQITGESALPAGVNGSDIHFRFKSDDGTITVNKTWAQLIAAPGVVLVNNMGAHTTEDFKVSVKVDDTVSTDNISIPSFNFTFTGTE
jgi:hypothetical protein